MRLWLLWIAVAMAGGLGLGQKKPTPPPEPAPESAPEATPAATPAPETPPETPPENTPPTGGLGLGMTAPPPPPAPTVVQGVISGLAREIWGMPESKAQELWSLELARSAATRFKPFLEDPDPDVRARAATALGQLRGPGAKTAASAETLSLLTKALGDAEAKVRTAAAFGLGLTPGSGSALLERWKVETDSDVRHALMWGLARQGGSEAVAPFVAALSGWEVSDAAIALGMMGARKVEGVQQDEVVAALLGTLKIPVGDGRRSAAWAIGRMGLSSAPPDLRHRLLEAAVQDSDAVVQAWLIRGWAGVVPGPERIDGLRRLSKDSAAPVRIAVARAIGRYGCSGALDLLDPLLNAPESNVRIEAINASVTCPVDIAKLQSRLGKVEPLEEAAVVQTLAARNSLTDLQSWISASRPLPVRLAAIGALKDREMLKKLSLEGEVPAVRSTAADTLVQLKTTTAGDLIALLAAGDEVVLELAASGLAEHPDPTAEAALLNVLKKETLSPSTVSACFKALSSTYLTGKIKKPSTDAPGLFTRWLGRFPALATDGAGALGALHVSPPPPPAQNLPSLRDVLQIRSARIFTESGEIRVALFPEEAPYTVWNFATLSENGFYDNLLFHRVVPDFVIQGGDPRGDGSGGPGYAIPDEISMLRYKTGTLGMALSGPDTGGSQWFITLSPQPHLEGLHAIFGQVVYGMDVAQRMIQGQHIQHIQIERVP